MNEGVVARITEAAERVAARNNIEIVDVEMRGAGKARVLRIFIDKAGGVSHGDCEWISRHVGEVLDAEDMVPGDSYTLEVSSPGVERPLSKPRDFERNRGSRIKVVLRDPIDGSRLFDGVLAESSADAIVLEPQPGRRLAIPLSNIKKANLKFEW
jgi:ribosome maturation factor RimP